MKCGLGGNGIAAFKNRWRIKLEREEMTELKISVSPRTNGCQVVVVNLGLN